ncbi:hypothetical protein M0R72_04250 [Candidatus Pacearchaeota archaeon]|jgi:hypothetical protein|nr:hypothetical protein [Candidatus Pacearchaeota archaeon]
MVKKKFKWDWKIFWIIVLLFFLLKEVYFYSQLTAEYEDYKQKVKDTYYELGLNLTQTLSEYELNVTRELANLDCFDRGTVECYDKGTVVCYKN